jgi:hypothetical protein
MSKTELEVREHYTADLSWDERNQVLLSRMAYFQNKGFNEDKASSLAYDEFRTIKHIYVENESDVVGDCYICKKIIFHSKRNYGVVFISKEEGYKYWHCKCEEPSN